MPMNPIIKSFNPDISKNAYMNWRTDQKDIIWNLIVMADGYYEAAKMLADAVLENNSGKKADALVYPMVFDLNQSMELYLKASQWMLNRLNGYTSTFENGHNLIGLYYTMLRLITDFRKNHPDFPFDQKSFNNMMSGVDSYIDELKHIIPENDWKSMDYPRYPIMSDKATPHFYIEDSDNVTIDIEYFRMRAEGIHDALESLTMQLQELCGFLSFSASTTT